MGLYLCIFDGQEEVEGVEIGTYADFNGLREYLVTELEGGRAGCRFPTFILHSDSDGEWGDLACIDLRNELNEIISEMKTRAPTPFISEWQNKVARSVGLVPKNALESFIDVDGELLLERIDDLAAIAIARRLSILFQ
ncbi:hypothetical protein FSO04_01255 [Paraburkholderia madseniana]|jgi:hypothetical protein|uniref:Uncharacterized protein n=1 Tax=Paraburkholderia madseniana TaxID=2599607 RepID=A0A6N6WQR9_9BURK|nr:Imm70 family immunity protein [Paraburkholderia madseniana]KAE8762008.1 hypothetical protein FSO04_01255 [Paraburkholderia madseniana]